MVTTLKKHPLIKIISSALVTLPTPSSLSGWWNFGSMLGLCLMIQILSGFFLAMHYTASTSLAFESLIHIAQDVNYGNLLRTIHANGASFFFICLYLHTGRGMYYSSFNYQETWSIGVLILLLTMGAAFLGYVLPWGQMSFWGTTVITNLLSALPYIGENIVMWLWGGFAVGNPTLTRFFSFHFLVPFIVALSAVVHLLFLHQTGSNNPLGLSLNKAKISFHPFFSFKDLVGFIVGVFILGSVVITSPWMLGDPENFIPANPLVTPVHIQPEWYFLFAYAILRSIPNKLGGVIALAGAIMILWIMPLMPYSKFKSLKFYPLNQFYFWLLINSVFLLTWVGARPVEEPFVLTGQLLTFFYFSYFILSFYLKYLWDSITN